MKFNLEDLVVFKYISSLNIISSFKCFANL